MITQDQVFEQIRKEAEYASGWAKGSRKQSDVHSLAPLNGQPYSLMDFVTFADKYLAEAKLAYANFTPDGGAVRIRLLKVVSLLVRALQVHGRGSDLERLAGKSSSEFPVIGGGLKKFNEVSTAEGCLIQTPETRGLINESPECSPLKH